MKFFACVLDTAGQGIGEDLRRHVQSMAISRLLTYRWDTFVGAAVLTGWDEFGGEISIERFEDWIAVGRSRLDNRSELEPCALSDGRSDGESDLAVILRLVAHSGAKAISTVLGEFGFIAWHEPTRTAIGASDAFNLVRLYFTQHRGYTLIGSRAEPLSMTNRYNVAYLADQLTDYSWRHHTVYAGVELLPAASILTLRDGRVSTTEYWSASDWAGTHPTKVSQAEAIETCRDLLITAIRRRLDPGGRTWSQLSGGLDSSSVVSVAQWLAEQGQVAHGLDGTLTFVIGSQTSADERSYSNEVIRRWRVRNEVVVDAPMWFDDNDDTALPLSDQPLQTMLFDPIDGRFRAILREAGARVLLTGWGSDHLFPGIPLYLADHLVQGRPFEALSDMAHRAALERGSFWKNAYHYLIKPFVPASIRKLGRSPWHSLPNFFRLDTLRRVGIMHKPNPFADGRVGRKFAHYRASTVGDTQRGGESLALGEFVSVRHPFLYRPLVEFGLGLPPEWTARPLASKWILREAMRGIVPEVVRTRPGKGGGGDSFARMFIQQRAFFEQLARDPILADLGLVDAHRLMTAVEESSDPRTWNEATQDKVLTTLLVEAWLQVRSGRWPHGFAGSQVPVVPHQETYQLTATQRRSV